MPSVTCTKIAKDPGGRIRFRFDNREYEFVNLAHLQSFVAATLDIEVLHALFMRMAMDRQPTLANVTNLEGHGINVDLSVNNWGTVT